MSQLPVPGNLEIRDALHLGNVTLAELKRQKQDETDHINDILEMDLEQARLMAEQARKKASLAHQTLDIQHNMRFHDLNHRQYMDLLHNMQHVLKTHYQLDAMRADVKRQLLLHAEYNLGRLASEGKPFRKDFDINMFFRQCLRKTLVNTSLSILAAEYNKYNEDGSSYIPSTDCCKVFPIMSSCTDEQTECDHLGRKRRHSPD